MPNTMATNWWRSALTESDFFTADVTVTAGQFNLLGKCKLDPGQLLALGYGELAGQQDADGRIYIDLQNATPAAIDGVLQIAYYDSTDHLIQTEQEYRTETLRTNSTDRTKQIPFPIAKDAIKAFQSVHIYFKPDANGTVSAANSKVMMDVTRGKTA